MPEVPPSLPANRRRRVLVALSGGVDSSVAALRLVQAGHEVIGVFMRNGVSGGANAAARERSCCSASDARDAADVADRLGIPFYSLDYEREFSALIDHFAAEYRRGRTPNPCVLCNQHLKFGHVLSLADALGASQVATGHYARIHDGRLRRAVDRDKDQTYYLFGIDAGLLPRICFPLGDLDKPQVRAMAHEAGLVTAAKRESMEICFVPDGRYREVVRTRGGAGTAGVFVDREGRVLGEHDGVDGFTVGQRRGLPALGTPHFVTQIRPADGTVVLGERAALEATEALVRDVNWLAPPATRAAVQIRARAKPQPARVEALDADATRLRVTFAEPVSAVTPGQAAVFYDGDVVLGGGWIDGPP
ncbi:MAG: tRNA 2-thiouridine(34) synthase MnmA [Planctomycetota bacterium]